MGTNAGIELAKHNNIQLAASRACHDRAAEAGPALYTVLFFDEVNTCNHQGFIKSLVCDGMLDGVRIQPSLNLRFVCALNPYQKHTDGMIKKLEHAGLGRAAGAAGTEEICGTPLRHLVYRVQPLPETLRNCVWDFGQLSRQTEDKYIRQIIDAELVSSPRPTLSIERSERPAVSAMLSSCLSQSQSLMRTFGDECSFVSLRDIERALTLFLWFHSKSKLLMLDKAAQDGDEACTSEACSRVNRVHPTTRVVAAA